MKYLTIIYILLALPSLAQNDTLNKYDPNGKKQGYWICYLDEKLNRTVDSANAKYCGFELFDNGKNLTNISVRSIKISSLEVSADTNNKHLNCRLLNGRFVFYYKNKTQTIKSIEEYKNGYPLKIEVYKSDTRVGIKECMTEFIDFSKKYNNEKGSFYWEEKGCYHTKLRKYWYRKVKGKWKSVRIE